MTHTTEQAHAVHLARAVHEIFRALQDHFGDECPSPPWASEDPDVRALTIAGVERALAGTTPQAHHAAWCDGKRDQGWVYGPVKDPAAKTHPNLVPYGELPPQEQAKDRVFLAIVAALTGPQEAPL